MSESELIDVLAQAQAYLNRANTEYESAFASHVAVKQPLVLLEEKHDAQMDAYLQEHSGDAIKAAINQMAKTDRITSYNVCYTKLLRTLHRNRSH